VGHGKTLPKNKVLGVVSVITEHLSLPRQLITTETPIPKGLQVLGEIIDHLSNQPQPRVLFGSCI
jgi:hypothetical protein